MYTALIADDFFVEREKIMDIIERSDLGITLVGECSNGVEALGMLERTIPDLLLTDIEMPFIDGLELAVKVREKYPQIEIIFLSHYNRFEYAHKAIELEANAYILKPIIREEMLKCLKKVLAEVDLKQKRQQYEKQLQELIKESRPLLADKFKRDLLLGVYTDLSDITERLSYLGFVIKQKEFLVLSIEADDYLSLAGEYSLEQRELYFIKISKIIMDAVEVLDGAMWVKMDDAHWAVLISNSDKSETGLPGYPISEAAYALAESILEASNKKGISLSIGLSPVYNDITRSHEKYQNALNALQHKFSLGKGQIIDYEDIHTQSGTVDIALKELQEGIDKLFNSCKESEVGPYIEKVFSKCKRNTSNSTLRNLCFSIMVCVQISLDNINISLDEVFGREYSVWEKLIRFETILDVKNWLYNAIVFLVRYINEKNCKGSKKAVQDTKAYIEANYGKRITVSSIADALFYNANYLNNLFKQETGETILEYITKVRINAAKQMLQESTGMKSYEIVETVGYCNEAHFRSVFKRFTGMTPKEYKERMKR